MGKGRLEAFSDGVIAIIITIMVLDFKRPADGSINSLLEIWPTFAIYALSFVYVGIYWNNHHHMFHAARSVTGGILWANLFVLFWLSLVPFASSWLGGNYDTAVPVALYGLVLLMTALAYAILAALLVRHEGKSSLLATAFGKDWKTRASIAGYAFAIAIAFVEPVISLLIYGAVALSWFIPDPRIERALARPS